MSKRVTLLLMGIGLVILGSGLVMPWFTIDAEGFSLSYIYIAVFYPAAINPPWPFTTPYDLFDNISQALLGYPVFAVALVLYPLTLSFGIVSLIRNKLKLVAGILGFSTGVIWIVGTEFLNHR
jgi:quinol-cytochrome oxidoreductase complex cytochrome b subunit